MLLLELEEDVLVHIFYFLDYQDFINLALACRTLFNIAGRPEHFSILTPEDRYGIINRCATDPSYGHRAHSLDLQIQGRGTARADVFDLLQRMPNVKRLNLGGNAWPGFAPVLLKEDLLLRSSLQELIYTSSSLEFDDMLGFLALPHLRILKIRNTGGIVWSQENYPLHQPPQVSHLERCDLPTTLYMRSPALECILSSCPVLETLICTVALSPSPDNPAQNNNRIQPRNFCSSPYEIAAALNNVSHTLVNLHLFASSRRGQIRYSSNLVLDLSGFGALKNITASADFWFTRSSSLESRDGFYKMLPPRLETISIHFGLDIGLFYECNIRTAGPDAPHYSRPTYKRIDTEGRKRFSSSNLDQKSYNFITEVAQHKQARYPMLRSFELKELTRGSGRTYEFEEWGNPPSEIVEAFEIAGVELKVGVRKDQASEEKDTSPIAPPRRGGLTVLTRAPRLALGRLRSALGSGV